METEILESLPQLITGLALIAIAWFISNRLKHWTAKRAFERRNPAGIEEFKSYKDKVRTERYERSVEWRFGCLAFLFAVVGIVLIAMFLL